MIARAKATAIQAILEGNADILRQAIEMAPNAAFLLFLGATHSLLTPAEHLELSKRFHEQDPQNALAAFIHAAHLLKTGDSAAGLDILRSSGTRPMERTVLDGMADDWPSPYDGLTVAEARICIDAQRRQLQELTYHLPDHDQLLRNNPQALELFLERSMRDGEVAALRWRDGLSAAASDPGFANP